MGTKIVKISGLLCFAQVKVDKSRAECTVKLQCKSFHEELSYTFTHITERFDPWAEIKRLRFVSEVNGRLKIECVKSIKDKELSDQPAGVYGGPQQENQYKGLENQIVKYIHGSPIRMFTLGLLTVPSPSSISKKALQITVLNPEFNKVICTVEVPEERIFRDILPHLLQGSRSYSEELSSLLFKSDALAMLISRYIKNALQMVVVGVDISEQQMLSGATSAQRAQYDMSSSQGSFGCIGIVDRDVKALKFRHTEFPGLRVPTAALALNQNLNATQSPQKGHMQFSKNKAKSTGGSQVHRNMLAQQNEKMKNAVIDHLGKKKDFAALHATNNGTGRHNIMSNATPVNSSHKLKPMVEPSEEKKKSQQRKSLITAAAKNDPHAQQLA